MFDFLLQLGVSSQALHCYYNLNYLQYMFSRFSLICSLFMILFICFQILCIDFIFDCVRFGLYDLYFLYSHEPITRMKYRHCIILKLTKGPLKFTSDSLGNMLQRNIDFKALTFFEIEISRLDVMLILTRIFANFNTFEAKTWRVGYMSC